MKHIYRLVFSLLFLTILSVSTRVQAAEWAVNTSVGMPYTSNVFLNRDKTWDLAITPRLDFNLDFADFWSFGYEGGAAIYTQNTNLLAHDHQLYLLVNPAWGKENQNEWFARLSLGTDRFLDDYSSINNLKPALDLGLTHEPAAWFRWSLAEYLSYHWFYDNKGADYLDAWSRVSAQFTFQSRTTLAPRFAYGYRFYTRGAKKRQGDRSDQQLEAGLHMSQGLWENAGLQADYAYLHAFDASGLIKRNFSSTSFNYLDTAFLWSGHKASLGLKQLFAESWTFTLDMRVESRAYKGWEAMSKSGTLTGKDRADLILSPSASLDYAWTPPETASQAVPVVKTGVSYAYLRQFSNDSWYDTDQHTATINLKLSW